MNKNSYRRIRQGAVATLTGVMALPVMWALAPMTAHAAACTQTITGAHSGILNVAGGQKLCLRNAVQTGVVDVASKGSLSVVASTIVGDVTLKAGYTELEFCGSTTARGAISATGGTGSVVIGGSGLLGAGLCPSNSINGAVTLNGNKAGVTLAGNVVAGGVTASSNLGGTTISANRVTGALTCTSNVPAPTNAGAKNTVGGARSGQTCAVATF